MEDGTTPSPILRTKLNRPPVLSDHVHRTRLLDELEKRRERPLTLISAPAGYGKSTLASCWLAASDCPGAWLSLDERDNDLRLFLTYFLEAIRTLFPTALQETLALLKAGSLPPVSVLAASLLNELEGIEQEFILVLDDFHRIQNPSVLDLLAEVLRYPAEPMHLVLAGRRDPFLAMSNLRARGLVTEIRAQGLRFTAQETASFLDGALADRVEEATAAVWAEKTEGWVTGLRLAALSLCHQADAGAKMLEIVGSSRYLTEYFYEEVLAGQTPDVRQHLLRSSILDRFCAPLCDALYEPGIEPGPPEIDGQGFINWLQENKVFLISLDLENRWFRYHRLFQDLLRGQLKRQCSTEEIATLRSHATDWLSSRGLIEEAIEQAITAGDFLRAAELVEQNRLSLLNDEKWYVLDRWLARLPDRIKQRRAELLLAQAWGAFFRTNIEEASPILDQVESLLSSDARDLPLLGEVDFFRGYLFLWQGEAARGLKNLEEALELIPITHHLIRGEAEEAFGLAAQLQGETERAVHELNKLLYSHPPPHPVRKLRMLAGLTSMHMISGELIKALSQNRELLDLATQTQNSYAKAYGSYVLGLNHFARNELDGAILYLSHAADQRYIMPFGAAVDAMAALTYAYQSMVMPKEAEATMSLLSGYADSLGDPNCLTITESCKARFLIMQGNGDTAGRLLKTNETPPLPFLCFSAEIPAITDCRVLLAEGSSASLREAEKRLQEYLQESQVIHNTLQTIGMMPLLALAYQKQGRQDEALPILERALILARPGGIIRPFIEPGPQMADLLKQLKTEKEDTLFIDQILAAFGEHEERVAPEATDAQPAPVPPTTAQPLIEPLTIRELETLELLNQGMYNREIADKLSISLETVKSHLRNIYQKLGVGGRRQAVHRARILDILPRL